ncbi:pilus assembly FimT family protein [Phytopseudomonas dryadis]|uniref:Prepilin-type cleavage/methylation domain-containing protein n=1 Tax=Phytopseudomonas dryadis TaxID=2487520 RepID=A0A4Q9R5S3_9GAMM|nr:prepilin-type N-terminal cleavage/methylation domain-containing protein [Pseudomonas dryadis]TBU95897.1 prepilin-type cleavage/methylation domain-containing protein [Pseudomonas dryadis]
MRGFTLIELMITLAVLALLMFVGLPLTNAWVNGAQQQTAASLLREGIGRAKAQALRNPRNVQDISQPAALLCRSGQVLKIPDGDACTDTASWTAQLPAEPAVKLGSDSSDLVCVAFNSRGLPIASGDCEKSDIKITVSSQDDILVPLL